MRVIAVIGKHEFALAQIGAREFDELRAANPTLVGYPAFWSEGVGDGGYAVWPAPVEGVDLRVER